MSRYQVLVALLSILAVEFCIFKRFFFSSSLHACVYVRMD